MERSGRLLPGEGHLGETLSIMLPAAQKKDHFAELRPPFECTALLLQGGGALCAYQAGVYEALSEAGIHPDWVAGISIGAVNSAIIAGNPPEKRVEALRRFWERTTSDVFGNWTPDFLTPLMKGDWVRGLMNQVSANSAMLSGASGFFVPRLPSPWIHPRGSIEATSLYDASGLKNTLESLVDFDRINAREMRFSVGAVNVRSGNFVYFDSTTHTIRPEHVMAQRIRNTVAALIESLPDDLKDEPRAKLLGSIADRKVYNMVHLIYRAKNYEGNSKDYEYSRSSMQTHWRAGYHDTVRTLRHPDVLERPTNHEGVAVFDLERDGRD